MLKTSRETDGYDGKRGRLKWWFEAWGDGSREQWTTRDDAGRPPTPGELARADYIVFGFDRGNGRVFYRTRVGGLDFRPATARGGSKRKAQTTRKRK
jgi:hypothetical protein